ncbi:MAG: glycosyltransferase family 2 protein [Eubacterium sp.]|nr:glycosyltransferase family 2 protein [Eubacterium sp.]
MDSVLSLIIPTYNCIEYLDETLGSVLPQLPADFELVLVDDGSDDGTAGKLAALREGFDAGSKPCSLRDGSAASDDGSKPGSPCDEAVSSNDKSKSVSQYNVKVVLRGHEGVSSARNAGIEAASGDRIAFMDCDDLLMDGFFNRCREVMKEQADLYIFGFERVELTSRQGDVGTIKDPHRDGERDTVNGRTDDQDNVNTERACSGEVVTPVTLPDRVYASTSDFADDYVRTRHLLVYSACNKIYKKVLLDEHGVGFREGLEFGEDRLFNYDYLRHTGGIVTSSAMMFRYMQRNPDSASKKTYPDYYETVMMLHKAKMDCFLALSEGTTEEEKRAFEEYDLATEIDRMVSRFDAHPEEKEKNLPLIRRLV